MVNEKLEWKIREMVDGWPEYRLEDMKEYYTRREIAKANRKQTQRSTREKQKNLMKQMEALSFVNLYSLLCTHSQPFFLRTRTKGKMC